MSTFKSRLQEFISSMSLNASGFSVELGYDSPEKIYRLLRDEKNKPSLDILQDISNRFEALNIDWLLNGRGVMLNGSQAKGKKYKHEALSSVIHEPDEQSQYNRSKSVSFYMDWAGVKELVANNDSKPCFVVDAPAYLGCSVEQCHATTLEKVIPKESWLFISRVERWQDFLEYGRLYMIELTDMRKLFYRIEQTQLPGKISLVPLNESGTPVDLDNSLVASIWLIKGYLPPALI